MTSHENIIAKPELNVNFDICFTDNQIVANHWHNHLEILYVLEGAMHVKCNGQEYMLEREGMFVFNSGEIHYTRSAKNTKVILLQVPYEFLNSVLQDYDAVVFEQYFPRERIVAEVPLQRGCTLLLHMKAVFEQAEDGYALLFGSDLNRLLYELYTHYSVRRSGSIAEDDRSRSRLKEIITYVEQHYAEGISSVDVAKQFALNPEYFCRYFKKYMGMTFLEYVNMVRVSRIYQDLIRTEESISQIQERHGFTNDKVFRRLFREVYGGTPSQVKKNIKSVKKSDKGAEC